MEQRFGWLRQLSGANFYISCKQLLEAEKRIRALSLIKSGQSLSFESDMIFGNPIAEHVQQVELKLRPVSDDAIENLPMEDKAAIFFVSGYAGEHSNTNFIILNHLNCCKAVILIYIGRSVSRSNRCESCRSLLVYLAPPTASDTATSEMADTSKCYSFKNIFLNQECQRADLNIFDITKI